MSNHDNHRRGDKKRTEHGPRWEGGGSDNSAVARTRKAWRTIGRRQQRRTGTTRSVMRFAGGRPDNPPPFEEE